MSGDVVFSEVHHDQFYQSLIDSDIFGDDDGESSYRVHNTADDSREQLVKSETFKLLLLRLHIYTGCTTFETSPCHGEPAEKDKSFAITLSELYAHKCRERDS